MNAKPASTAKAPIVAASPIPAFAPLLKPVSLWAVADGEKVLEDVGVTKIEDVAGLEVDEEDVIVEENELEVELDVELVDSENVLAATTFVFDVNVTPTGSSTATFPFGSSATSWAWHATGKIP